MSTSKTFFLYTIQEWNKLDPNIRRSSNNYIFRKALLKFIKHVARKIFNINEPFKMKMLRRVRLGFNHLCNHECHARAKLFLYGCESTYFPQSYKTDISLFSSLIMNMLIVPTASRTLSFPKHWIHFSIA